LLSVTNLERRLAKKFLEIFVSRLKNAKPQKKIDQKYLQTRGNFYRTA